MTGSLPAGQFPRDLGYDAAAGAVLIPDYISENVEIARAPRRALSPAGLRRAPAMSHIRGPGRLGDMRIAIAGGTGTLGSLVAAELARRGHEARVLSRGAPEYRVDLATGSGLAPALAGCDVVVDASNNSSRHAAQVLVAGTQRLLAAEQAAGVRHHVCVSIVGCEQAPMGYYRVKVEQERMAAQGPMPCSVVRATQFHELVLAALTAAGGGACCPCPGPGSSPSPAPRSPPWWPASPRAHRAPGGFRLPGRKSPMPGTSRAPGGR